MFLFKYVSVYLYLLLLSLLIKNSNPFLVFPLKTLLEKNFFKVNNSANFNSEDLLNYYLPNEMFTYLYIGTPPTKINAFLDHENYGSYLDNSICPLLSKYNNETSSSFIPISDYIVSYSHFSHMCFAKENFCAYTDFGLDENNIKQLGNISFLYAQKPKNDSLFFKLNSNQEITGYSCFHIGLQIPTSSNYYEPLIRQFKINDYIETTYWTIEFKNNGNNFFDNEANLVIGVPPHEYNPKKYNEKNFRSVVSQLRIKNYDEYRVNIWGIVFDKIYFLTNNDTYTNNELILQTTKCKVDFGINLIEGSNNYLNNIENEFFKRLYDKDICFKEKRKSEKNGIYFVIWCKKSYYEEIKKFPTLYLKSNELEYIFELNHEDLFLTKGDKIFFLIIFRSSQGMFSFGKLFFKKYLFTFSFDNKIIGFYNDKLNINSDKINIKANGYNNGYETKRKVFIFILSVVFIIIILAVFIKIKKKYLTDRQKRINELIDNNYIYMSNKAKDNLNNKSTGSLEN